ncbi:MAG: hypothetical protein OSJ65_02600 [Bacilli bacterium]|nr:hypothetical protein [Bacilli bacterium]
MNEEKKCDCTEECECGCQEGMECTCEGECHCECQEGEECNCENCECDSETEPTE